MKPEKIETGGKSNIYDGTVNDEVLRLLYGNETPNKEVSVIIKEPIVDGSNKSYGSGELNILSTIEEAYVLDSIRRKQGEMYPGSKPFVPKSVLLQDFNGVPALVMEKLDRRKDNLMYQLSNLTPQQFQSICIQYFKLVDIIHQRFQKYSVAVQIYLIITRGY